MTLADALRGDLGDWDGLPTGLSVAELGALLGGVTQILDGAPAQRGSRRFLVSVLERHAPPRQVEAWVELGAEGVAMVEYPDPAISGLDETLARLGPPDLVLADRRFVTDATVRDHVYARRGLAVSIAEPFTDAPGHERRAVHLQLFAPTSPETYLTEIDRGDELAPKTHPRQEADRP